MRKILRFNDLKAAGVVGSWVQLKRLVDQNGMPPGRKLSDHARVWFADEIDAWLESRPLAGQREHEAA